MILYELSIEDDFWNIAKDIEITDAVIGLVNYFEDNSAILNYPNKGKKLIDSSARWKKLNDYPTTNHEECW